MAYVVDLTLILQAVFRVSLQQSQFEIKVTEECINEIVYRFHCLAKKKHVHDAIRAYVGSQHPYTKDDVADKIESLIKDNEVCCLQLPIDPFLIPWTPRQITENEMHFNRTPSLFTAIGFEV